jgi:hypothetical protein
MGTFLSTYIDEEIKGATGNLDPERVPEAVRIPVSEKDVLYIVTNVGYYATFLKTAVQQLLSAVPDGQTVALATVTYILPPYWWNWPVSRSEHRPYKPVDDLRGTLEWLTGKDIRDTPRGRVFRKVIVAEWDTDILASRADWEELKNWRLLLVNDNGKLEPATTQTDLSHQCVSTAQRLLVEPLKWFENENLGTTNARPGYWVLQSDFPNNEGNLSPEKYKTTRVVDYYRDIMHPPKCGGYTTIHSIGKDLFHKPLFGPSSGDQGLNGCSEITFLGSTDSTCEDAWKRGGSWGLALLSTMSPGRETMFVTAVWGEETLDRLWSNVKSTISKLELLD